MSNISNRFYAQTSETDFNRLTKSGYYFGKLVQNTPDGTTDSNWIIEVQTFDNNPNYVFQRVTRASDKAIFTRIKNNRTWSDWEVLAKKSDLSSSQNRPYIVTCTNAIDQSLFMNAQFRARRTENGTGAAAFGFENVGVNSGALYLDPSDYKLHFINYEGKKFVINWTAEN